MRRYMGSWRAQGILQIFSTIVNELHQSRQHIPILIHVPGAAIHLRLGTAIVAPHSGWCVPQGCWSATDEHSANTQRCVTLTVLVTTIDAQWEGMGDVGSARYEPALLPPCPTIRVLSYSN